MHDSQYPRALFSRLLALTNKVTEDLDFSLLMAAN